MKNLFSILLITIFLFSFCKKKKVEQKVQDKSVAVYIEGDRNKIRVILSSYELTEKEKTEFKKIAVELKVKEAAIFNLFDIMKVEKVPVEKLGETFEAMLERLQEAALKLDNLKIEDPFIKNLRDRAREQIDEGNFQEATKLLEEAKEKSQKAAEFTKEKSIENYLQAAEFKVSNAELQESLLKYEKADKYYKESIQLVPEEKKDIKALYLAKYGMLLGTIGKSQEAVKYYKKAIEIREPIYKKSPDLLVISRGLGVNYFNYGTLLIEREPKKGTEFIQKAYELAKATNYLEIENACKNFLGVK